MKKNIIFFFLLFLSMGYLFSSYQVPQGNNIDHRLAQVNQAQGVLLFMQSNPVAPYTVVGTVKKHREWTWSGSPTEMFNTIVRKVKRKYPETEAIIFDAVDMEHVTCIKFK